LGIGLEQNEDPQSKQIQPGQPELVRLRSEFFTLLVLKHSETCFMLRRNLQIQPV